MPHSGLLRGAVMKVRTISLVSAAVVSTACFAGVSGVAVASQHATSPGSTASAGGTVHPWANARLAPDRRSALLVAQMTLDEKIAMVHGAGYPQPPNGAGYAGVVP